MGVINPDYGNENKEGKILHKKFKSTVEGIDWNSFPMRLFELGEKLRWNAYELDFSQDAEQWKNMKPSDKMQTKVTSSYFIAGEECVARDILPLAQVMEELGFVEETLYLTQFARDEANHTVAFRRWFESVGETEGIYEYTYQNEPYRKLFYEIIPTNMRSLYKDPSPENIIRAVVSYMFVAEGILAETGYYGFVKGYEKVLPVLPGLYKMVKLIVRDEARHISFGAYVAALMISMHGERLLKEFINYFNSLSQEVAFPLIEVNRKILLSPKWRDEDIGPLFNYFTKSDEGFKDVLEFAGRMFQQRYAVIEKAVKLKPEQVRRIHLKDFGLQD
ncbi:ribonucleotide-diphosphate reductase subunit beta [Sulfolobus sp. A20]|uniref:R2-like ligand-binding oxidase n=1 Tax=Sulfolobaceae TaxID=118883 RepID=UPI000845EBA2|nr:MULTISPECIES: R2-like ligand-binding oxidase [unclassified Sulfolobus]TRM75323.1 R2-like ligand-binding oxidase [Sulfolobus sp. A20-N-F8]TRM75619.1 R2-like ligand-binding oxidase [Sulfolobus sp. B5]TRM81951.1 R2-like ligand-binding oxidase [Sulfolobus sp. D5]TRM85035.1 R2-like ligand-binding oxidase [Sulfolobus sp. F3]TRM89532.1 R2-like ligand-binding oxidase [Sulfolobus sp. C3]TRM98930.1 R2-like ligand-binding oxidase [Sulfolobus sp. E1]TRN00131.1 R2-like ligand-binding oxidase [Sulfolob